MNWPLHRIPVKICGITSPRQALDAAASGADAIGLVFAPSSREIDLESAASVCAALPPMTQSVGVFVDPPAELVDTCVKEVGIDLVQLHGSESPEFCSRWPNRILKALRIKDSRDLEAIAAYKTVVRGFVLDAYSESAYGGTGKVSDWDLARKAVESSPRPIILAGGLGPDNIAQAVQVVRPYGVDASSRLEKSPGEKDMNLVREFISKLRSIEKT